MRRLLALLSLPLSLLSAAAAVAADGNRLTYLDDDSPFWPTAKSPKFITPQWVGEAGVEAVVVLAIDDMREPAKHEAFLRPILDRLKKIDGRAPVSIMTNTITPDDPQLQAWLKEGLSLEVHTLTHPCPCLGKGSFAEAARVYHGGVDLLASVPNNVPVAFRMPCCDSMNSASPRFFAEIFNRTSPQGRHLAVDSSVFVQWDDERFAKYVPEVMRPPSKVAMKDYAGYIEDYSYPFVIGRLCWEFPCATPSDWQAFNVLGSKTTTVLADWKAALDRVVKAQGVMTTVFHPHGWSAPEQWVEFIDYAQTTYGTRVKFLTFREALERLEKNVLAGESLRAPKDGSDNGVRMLDIDGDGYMDVLTRRGNEEITRVWQPKAGQWLEAATPFAAVQRKAGTEPAEAGLRFAVLGEGAPATAFLTAERRGAWSWRGGKWESDETRLAGLPAAEKTAKAGGDGGFRFRDFDRDGACELLANREVYQWKEDEKKWKRDFSLPEGCALLDGQGRDNGLRFVDLNGDGFDDVLQSNEAGYAIYLWAAKVRAGLGWTRGWPHQVARATRKEAWKAEQPESEIPPFVVDGKNNGAWFHHARLAVQNEDTLKLEANTWVRTFKELIAVPMPPQKSPEESRKAMIARPGFTVELVAAEPLVESPVAFEWDARGRLWVVEMRDYPLGMDGKGKAGGVLKLLTDEDGDGHYDKAVAIAEGLPFPTGVYPWRDGVIVAAVPDILFLADRDGDGRAEERRVVYTGFVPGNQQHRMNGFAWGLDGWLYGANGDSGGKIKLGEDWKPPGLDPARRATAMNISGRDFRFRPETGAFEASSGNAQYGRQRDDWGEWFGNNNSTWIWHYTVEDRYLRRNPRLAVKSVRKTLANYDDSSRVFTAYPLEAAPTRMNEPNSLGHVTSACSVAFYRDELFGPDFATSAFICEPVHNAVHREVLEPEGATFSSHRAGDEQDREFLASTDQWFRPTMVKTGPDGALYIADMQRFVLEHPEWIAAETQSRVDLRAGAGTGRIWRVVPAGKKPRAIPNLEKLEAGPLAAAMDSPNGWQRDTVQRLLVERLGQREMPHEVSDSLRSLAAQAADPKVRVQALATLAQFSHGTEKAGVLRAGLRDGHPQVRVQALRAAETGAGEPGRAELLNGILACERDPEFIVRRQLAFTLGEFRGRETEALAALTRLAEREGDNAQMRVAILSSLKPEDALFTRLNAAPEAGGTSRTVSLPPASPDRAKVIAKYAKVSELKGDAARGHELFKTQCAICHRLKNEGVEVGPDLAMVIGKGDDWLVAAVFDPNAAIEARYQAQAVKLKSGAEWLGIAAAETANNITLRLPGGTEQAVLRSEIVSEKALGRSLMPEGLEAVLDAQAVADIFAWLRAK